VDASLDRRTGIKRESDNMKLMIDNLDGKGLQDYTAAIDMSQLPQLRRKLNVRTELEKILSCRREEPGFVLDAAMARKCFMGR